MLSLWISQNRTTTERILHYSYVLRVLGSALRNHRLTAQQQESAALQYWEEQRSVPISYYRRELVHSKIRALFADVSISVSAFVTEEFSARQRDVKSKSKHTIPSHYKDRLAIGSRIFSIKAEKLKEQMHRMIVLEQYPEVNNVEQRCLCV